MYCVSHEGRGGGEIGVVVDGGRIGGGGEWGGGGESGGGGGRADCPSLNSTSNCFYLFLYTPSAKPREARLTRTDRRDEILPPAMILILLVFKCFFVKYQNNSGCYHKT